MTLMALMNPDRVAPDDPDNPGGPEVPDEPDDPDDPEDPEDPDDSDDMTMIKFICGKNLYCHKSCLVIKTKEVELVKEVKRSDGLWPFACGDVSICICKRKLFLNQKSAPFGGSTDDLAGFSGAWDSQLFSHSTLHNLKICITSESF